MADKSRKRPAKAGKWPQSTPEGWRCSRRRCRLRDARRLKTSWASVAVFTAARAIGQEVAETNAAVQLQTWNWHVQNTVIAQYHPGFSAPYSGPNSMSSDNEAKETISLDLY